MQYLLTEIEYQKLKEARLAEEIMEQSKLQEFCTLAAKHIPVEKPWHHDESQRLSPWGCILDKDVNTGYCDGCPVSEICPSKMKRWSK